MQLPYRLRLLLGLYEVTFLAFGRGVQLAAEDGSRCMGLPALVARCFGLPAAPPGTPWCVSVAYWLSMVAVWSMPTLWFWLWDAAAGWRRTPAVATATHDVVEPGGSPSVRGKADSNDKDNAAEEEGWAAAAADDAGVHLQALLAASGQQDRQDEGPSGRGQLEPQHGVPGAEGREGGLGGSLSAAVGGISGAAGAVEDKGAVDGIRVVMSAHFVPRPAQAHSVLDVQHVRRDQGQGRVVHPAAAPLPNDMGWPLGTVGRRSGSVESATSHRPSPSDQAALQPSRYTVSIKVVRSHVGPGYGGAGS